MQRRATIAVALMLGSYAPVALEAQGGRPAAPGPDTPRLLVAVFASNDRASGVQAADAIRTRVANAVNIKQLYVIPKADITNYLESSGYKPDSSLGATDLKELAKLLRADEVLSGTATRSATGIRVEPRLMLARDPSLAQPLPAVDAGSWSDAARQIERSLGEARKQLPDNRICENHIRASEWDKAIAAAKVGITKYPNATIARLCLANTYVEMKNWDETLRVTDEIRRIDPKNSMALRFAQRAYQEKSDPENAVRALLGLLGLEPTNPTLQAQVVTELARLGKPAVAIPLVDSLLAQNPGDPQLIRQKWLLLLNAAASDTTAARSRFFSQALTTGEEMVRIDTTLADSVYFERQIGAASGIADQPQRAQEIAARAVQRFPNSAYFWRLKAQSERRAGQLQVARESMGRALSIDPKLQNASLFLAQLALDLQQSDSAVAIAQRAIASGEDPKTWGAFLLAPTQAAFKAAQESKSTADYERAMKLAQESDKLSPSSTAKFFIGVSAFSIGIDALQQAQKPKSCPLARRAQEMMLLTQINMPAGGQVDATVAKQILDYVGQYAPAADQMVKQYCKR
jgi:tetratricopeptide (TPR) repeat protein